MHEDINQWAARFGVSAQALDALRRMCGEDNSQHPKCDLAAGREAGVVQRLRMSAAHAGDYLWVNKNGACYTDRGRFLRYGIANESAAESRVIKSSDLIGVTRVTVQPQDVGHTIGVFTAYEVKKPGWKFTGVGRERAQSRWLRLIQSIGGFARFVSDESEVYST